jgi:glycosyltransferase involved in cell wall biosynthesis
LNPTAGHQRPPFVAPTSPRFSIVSVVLNAAELIGPTGASLKSQICKDYEWIVIDGASTDATLERVRDLAIANTVICSGPDEGIYDAMNQSLSVARGRWVYFLNAGDSLVDNGVLQDVAAFIDRNPSVALIHGDIRHLDDDGRYIESTDYVRRRWLVFEDLNHQAVFARRDLFSTVGRFNPCFRTSADYDWLVRAFRAGQATSHIPRVIADFLHGGMHAQHPQALAAERQRLRKQYASPLQLAAGGLIARVRRRLRIMRRIHLPPPAAGD